MTLFRRLATFMAALTLCWAPASALQSGYDLTGQWRGDNSGNQVTIEMRSGGFAIIVTGQRRAGQYGDGQFFRDTGSGLYLFTKPDGNKVRAQVLGPDTMQVTNPDGWTDRFRRTSAPRAVAAPPRPAPVAAPPSRQELTAKRPPARPAKMAAWSPKAISTEAGKTLSLRFAPERADALNSCRAAFQQWESQFSGTDETTAGFLGLIIEQYWLADAAMMRNIAATQAEIAKTDNDIASGNKEASRIGGLRAGRCVLQRRLAQLEGSPLAPGAVDGTLTPLSIGGATPPWKQQGKDARIIASNGKSAMHCVKLEQIASGDSKLSGGGRRLFNYCPEAVEIVWCVSPDECERESGNMWTVRSGWGWPVSANGTVRWAACLGANTAAFVKYTYGLRYYCSAPAAKPK